MVKEESVRGLNPAVAKPLAITAGILGLMQGIAWTVLAILCICCYTGSIEIDVPTLPNSEYYKLIYCIFLDSDYNTCRFDQRLASGVLIQPKDFLIFACFYIVFSVVWFAVSGTIIWAMIHSQWHLAKSLFGTWSITTIFVSIVDIVLSSLVTGDYITTNNDENETNILVAYGIIMVLSARGYVLWVVNIIFAGILMKYTINIILKGNNESRMPIIHGYESDSVNPPWFNGSVKDFWATTPPSTAQETIYTNHGFERSQSFFNMDPPEPKEFFNRSPRSPNNNNYPSPAPHKYHSNVPNQNRSNVKDKQEPTSFSEAIAYKTATIGRNKGRRSPLNHVEPPVIPEPDYTPPNSPNVLKGVLRSRSNYEKPLH